MKRALLIILIQQLFFCGYAQQAELVENLEVSQYANTSYLVLGSLTLKPGFTFGATQNISFFARAIESQQSGGSVSEGYNFVRTESVLIPGALTDEDVLNLGSDEKTTTFSYLDGWGRIIQSVAVQASTDKKDIIQPSYFDSKNRATRGYLPYKAVSSDGKFRSSALTEQEVFYTAPPAGIAFDPQAYSSVTYEESPLGRVLAATQIGEAYQDKFKISRMRVNESGEVRKWNLVSGLPHSSSTYAQGLLTVNESTDEEGAKSRVYTDFTGKTILNEVQASETEWLQTYYVYNDFGELLFTIPPAAADILSPSQADADLWYYQSLYDDLGRQIASKKPGAGWSYTIYDQWDRPVLTQDPGNRIRNPKEWNFVKYDIHNRPVVSGMYVTTLEMPALRTAVGSASTRDEIRNTSANGYSLHRAYPTTIVSGDVYSITYYDDYSFHSNSGWDPEDRDYSFVIPAGFADTKTTGTVKGLVTGTKSRTTEDTFEEWIFETVYYDKEYRKIQKVEGHILDGIARYTSEYAFSGETLRMFNEYTGSFGSHTVSHRYTYDDQRRPLAYYHQVDNNDEVLLAEYEYNDMGQLVLEKTHSRDNGANFFMKKYIEHNIRGVQTLIRYSSMDDVMFFEERIALENDLEGLTTPRFDGQLSAKLLEFPYSMQKILFQFTYDKSSRLLVSKTKLNDPNFHEWVDGVMDEDFSYDKNGNINSLDRIGTDGVNLLLFDRLSYVYEGNKLKSVTDNPSFDFVFEDLNKTGDDYFYNNNGDLIEDKNRNIESIAYNSIDLVDSFQLSENAIVSYKYDIWGGRLSEQEQEVHQNTLNSKDFIGELEFFNGVLGTVSFDGGQFDFSSQKYRFTIKDYQGTVWYVHQEDPSSARSIATFENSKKESEEQQFLNFEDAIVVSEPLFNHTSGESSNSSMRVLGGFGENIGIAKAITVLPGDTVRMEVFAKYLDLNKKRSTPLLFSVVNALAAKGVSTGFDGGRLNSIQSLSKGSNPFPGLVLKGSSNSDTPPAYLNYLFFDDNKNFKYGGFVQLSAAAREDGTNVAHERLFQEIIARDPGYFYIYVSNDSEEISETYFDDFSVEVSPSTLIQANLYFASGALLGEAVIVNEPRTHQYFQGKDYNRQTRLYNFHSRHYDAEISRWHAMDPQNQFASPYVGMGNNPVMMVDPDGEWVHLAIGAILGGTMNWISNGAQFNKQGLGAFGVGALAGALGAGIGSGVNVAMAGGSFGTGFAGTATGVASTGFLSGAATGASAGFTNGLVSGTGNSLIAGNSLNSSVESGLKTGGIQGLSAGLSGGLFGGLNAQSKDLNFWNGTAKINITSAGADGDIFTKMIKGRYVGEYEKVNVFESSALGEGYGSAGITLPDRGIFVGKDVFTKNLDPWLMKHEFGHILQARLVGIGPFYSEVGVPSLASATFGNTHSTFWTETWANHLSYEYFGRSAAWPQWRFPIQNISSSKLMQLINARFNNIRLKTGGL